MTVAATMTAAPRTAIGGHHGRTAGGVVCRRRPGTNAATNSIGNSANPPINPQR